MIYIEGDSVPLPNVMVESSLSESTSAARRDIKGGGVKVDGEKVADAKQALSLSFGKEHLIQRGKRHFVKVRVEKKK